MKKRNVSRADSPTCLARFATTSGSTAPSVPLPLPLALPDEGAALSEVDLLGARARPGAS